MTTYIPQSSCAAYKTAALIFRNGPLSQSEIFSQVQYGQKPHERIKALERAMRPGWLVQLPEFLIGLGCDAKAHFAAKEPQVIKPTGQVATARNTDSVFDRPPLTSKHIPSTKGFRDDLPTFAERPADHHFFTCA